MATAQVFSISKDVARGYKVPRGRPVLPNGAGVTAIMGLTNGRGAARRAAKKNCRDEDGKFTSCDYEPNTPSDERADRRRSRKAKSRKRPVSRGRRGRGTSFAAEVARKCRAARDDYAMVRGEFVSCDPGASTFGKGPRIDAGLPVSRASEAGQPAGRALARSMWPSERARQRTTRIPSVSPIQSTARDLGPSGSFLAPSSGFESTRTSTRPVCARKSHPESRVLPGRSGSVREDWSRDDKVEPEGTKEQAK